MGQWQWLSRAAHAYNLRFVRSVLIKAALLFALVNGLYAAVEPLPALSRLSLYNTLIPGRQRFPYADNPAEAYNVSVTHLEALFASHEIDGARKAEDEFRVLLLGDSGVWGWLLETDETFSACMNAGNHHTADGRRLRVFNLGYPITNALKDILILEYALRYQPDAVIWYMTLEGLYTDDQLSHPILATNREPVLNLIERFSFDLDTRQLGDEAGLLERSLVGQRRELADLLRNQVYGLAWLVSGYDHRNPRFFRTPVQNFPDSEGIPNRDYITRETLGEYLALDVVAAGMTLAAEADVPILLVNEPIFIGAGMNSNLRYNDLYPRWTYDGYRQMLGNMAAQHGWPYVDLWDFVPADRFTDFPLHYDAAWTCRVADTLADYVLGSGA